MSTDTLYIDIECIPSQHDWVIDGIKEKAQNEIENLTPPKSYKSDEAISKWMRDTVKSIEDGVDEEYKKAVFDGATNHIISIGCAFNDERPVGFTVKSGDIFKEEKNIINNFYDFFNVKQQDNRYNFSVVFVGHNISGFDLKILRQRSVILGIKPPIKICNAFKSKPWDENPYDTMLQWDAKKFVSMDKLAKAFGISGKGEVDGSMVFDMWKAGKYQEINDYCLSDVEMTRLIHKKMTMQD